MSHIIDLLTEKLTTNKDKVEAWFATTFQNTPPFFYTSVDIRHSGYKLAPVDTNVFPAGFNNLTEKGKTKATEYARALLAQYHPDVESILLIPENHTRNKFYLENISVLQNILIDAGKKVVIGTIDPEVTEQISLESESGKILNLEPLLVNDRVVQTITGFVPDLILTNNDFTSGTPDIIKDIKQVVIPPAGMGWYQRRKTSHFSTYNDLVRNFCQVIDLDPWLLSTVFYKCGVINFKEKKGIECIARGIEKTIFRIQEKYNKFGITETPYVFIKSNRGTYGMGIMTASSSDDIQEMGKKIRNKMNKIKGGTLNTEVIIQEGVPTIDQVGGNPAEHMLYMVAGKPVGCIYRINDQKDSFGNLNATGMHFQSMGAEGEMCIVLSTIARLASYAAAWECYEDSFNI
ncbi:MAG: glutamate--cysteine ligase [Rickettsiales bacterium]|nr:glutamate--cysteine ligase [Rickettsiales bacterium]